MLSVLCSMRWYNLLLASLDGVGKVPACYATPVCIIDRSEMDAWVQELTAGPAPSRYSSGFSKGACTCSHGLPIREQTEGSNSNFTGSSPNKEEKEQGRCNTETKGWKTQ